MCGETGGTRCRENVVGAAERQRHVAKGEALARRTGRWRGGSDVSKKVKYTGQRTARRETDNTGSMTARRITRLQHNEQDDAQRKRDNSDGTAARRVKRNTTLKYRNTTIPVHTDTGNRSGDSTHVDEHTETHSTQPRGRGDAAHEARSAVRNGELADARHSSGTTTEAADIRGMDTEKRASGPRDTAIARESTRADAGMAHGQSHGKRATNGSMHR